MSGATRDSAGLGVAAIQGCHLLWPAFPDGSNGYPHRCAVPRPRGHRCPRFRLFRFRSPLLSESRLISFPGGTEMCHFPPLAGLPPMYSEEANPGCPGLGCPIRGSPDQLVCSTPGLIAAYHALHRLSAPRHPPYTLSNLPALIRTPGQARIGFYPFPGLSRRANRMRVASRRHIEPGQGTNTLAYTAVPYGRR